MECFTVSTNEIKGRLDAFYFKPEYTDIINKVKNTKFNCLKLGDLISNLSGGATPKLEGDFYTDKTGIPFLRVQNVAEEGIKLDEVKYIRKEVHEGMLKRSQLKKDDIVFTITGRIGSVVVVPDNFEGNISQHSVRFHLKDSVSGVKINPNFISVFFNTQIGRSISFRNTTGGTRPALDYVALKNLPVPVPPLRTQNRIVEIMEKAYSQKKQKEAEAIQLLDSINNYVLEELGIKFKENIRKSFSLYFSKIQNRFDPLYYSQDIYYFLDVYSSPVKPIGEITKYLKTGFATGRPEQDLTSTGIIQIRPTNIDENGKLIFRKNIFIKSEKLDLRKSDVLSKGEILFNNTNSQELVGKTALFNLNEKYFCSNHITRIRVNEHLIIPNYLMLILNIYQSNRVFYKICTNWNNQSGVNINLLETVKIPLPPIALQNKIADEVKSRMKKAKQLQKEAKEIINKAKEKVEKIILG